MLDSARIEGTRHKGGDVEPIVKEKQVFALPKCPRCDENRMILRSKTPGVSWETHCLLDSDPSVWCPFCVTVDERKSIRKVVPA